ncbi:MAG: GTPase HflX [Oligoflexia bacterium]|nr:GTPase HflX [Oligoflexia bacterium]
METTEKELLNAILVGIQLPELSEEDVKSSLAELERLVTTLGHKVVGKLSQRRPNTRGTNILGDGKLQELASFTGGSGKVGPLFVRKKSKAALKFAVDDAADTNDTGTYTHTDTDSDSEAAKELAQVVVFDCELTPSQLRNMEKATGAIVLDRTGVIIEIFSRHARTKAARLQVEIARLTYVAPRLRESGGGSDRQGAGSKGPGETTLELDKRKIRDRIKELKAELESTHQEQLTRRARREQELSVALVGYTNAGKSSLMRAMTGSEVLVADKLFATLDTTVRPLYPETKPKILLSDTVGFINKLPHDLVASFRSTLDEALNASLILFLADASDPSFRAQMEVTKNVLAEVGASDTPHLLILNKCDLLQESDRDHLRSEFPEALLISTRSNDDLEMLRERLIAFFESDMVDGILFIPYTVKGVIGEIRLRMRVLEETCDEEGLVMHARAYAEDFTRLKDKFGIKIKKVRS